MAAWCMMRGCCHRAGLWVQAGSRGVGTSSGCIWLHWSRGQSVGSCVLFSSLLNKRGEANPVTQPGILSRPSRGEQNFLQLHTQAGHSLLLPIVSGKIPGVYRDVGSQKDVDTIDTSNDEFILLVPLLKLTLNMWRVLFGARCTFQCPEYIIRPAHRWRLIEDVITERRLLACGHVGFTSF